MSQCSNSPLPVLQDEPFYTRSEIVQQPLLWPTTLLRVQEASERLQLGKMLKRTRVLLTGAGSSAFAASSDEPRQARPRQCAVRIASNRKLQYLWSGVTNEVNKQPRFLGCRRNELAK
jgi:hypothetical protein